MVKVRIKYAKESEARFLSHLDAVRVLLRGARRANLPLCYSAGFSPKPKVSFSPPLPLGHTSETEYADFELETLRGQSENLMASLAEKLPPGFKLLSIHPDPPEPLSQICGEVYEVLVRLSVNAKEFRTALNQILGEDTLTVKRTREGIEKSVDVRKLIVNIFFEPNGEGSGVVSMMLNITPRGHTKPEEILQLMKEKGCNLTPGIYHRKRFIFSGTSEQTSAHPDKSQVQKDEGSNGRGGNA